LLVSLSPVAPAVEPLAGPALVRVQAEFIEVSLAQCDELLFGDHAPATDGELRQQVGQLVAQGRATMVETLTAVTRSDKTAISESIREFIYPTEFEPPQTPTEVRSAAADGKPALRPRDFAVGPIPSAWDKRNVGSRFEVEPTIEADGHTVTVRLVPEVVVHVKNEIWQEWKDPRGDAHVQMPLFYTLRCNTSVRTQAGKPFLVATLSPKGPDDLPDPNRKILLFVKCDILIAGSGLDPAAPEIDPFNAPPQPPRLVRAQVEFIEVSHARYAELMAGEANTTNDNALREKVGQLLAKHEAVMVESMMAVGKPGEKVTTESVTEFIYATEYEPGELPNIITLDDAASTNKSKLPDYATGPSPSAWDTRNLGPTFEMKPTIDGATDLVNLTLTAEIVHHCGNYVWCEWRDRRSHVPIQMPVFYTLRSTTEVLAAPNQYLMAAVLSPRDAKGFTDPTRKVMVFVKTEILCLPCGLAQEPDAEPPPPPMTQTQVEFIEVTQARYTALLAGNHTTSNDAALREKLAAMATKGEAEVVETMVCLGQDRQKATAESISEFTYPTEYEPPAMPPNAGSKGADEPTGPTPSAWDTRNLGSTLEVEPTLDEDTGTVDIRFVADVVRHVKNWIWYEWNGKHGASHVQMPVFHALQCNQAVIVMPGQPLLAATFTPKGPDGIADASRKIMVFVKCDLIPPGN
jgi:hypothetical protein